MRQDQTSETAVQVQKAKDGIGKQILKPKKKISFGKNEWFSKYFKNFYQ